MISFVSITTGLIALGCFLLGIFYAVLMYRPTTHLPIKLRYFLATLRTLAVGLTAFLLFAPLIQSVNYNYEKPIILLAHDNSLSIKAFTAKGFQLTEYQRDLNELEQELKEKYEVVTFRFGDSLRSGLNIDGTDKLSNASQLFSYIVDTYGNRNLGAIVLASDGIFNRGGNPSYELAKLKTPLYTVALGDTLARRDLAITNVNYNNLVLLDNEFVLEVQVQAQMSKGEQSRLTVISEGKQLINNSFVITNDNYVHEFKIKLKADKIGIRRYTIRLAPISNELTDKNNQQTLFIEVVDGRKNILIAAASPHPDLAVIKQSLELNPHYKINILVGTQLDSANFNKQDLIILHQLPNSRTPLSKLSQYKGSIWYVLGAQSDLSTFNRSQKSVSMDGGSLKVHEVFPSVNAEFATFDLNKAVISQFNIYPPLWSPNNDMALKGVNSVLLYQRIGKVNTQSPLWFFDNEQSAKRAFLLGEGLWRWRLEEAKYEPTYPLVNELIQKTVQYLTVANDKQQLKVSLGKSAYEENEEIGLNATLYNDAYELVNEPELQLELHNEQQKVYKYTFSKSVNGYQLNLGMLPSGQYRYQAKTSVGDKVLLANGAFFVSSLIAEYQQSQANHRLLYQLAAQQGGKMLYPNQLKEIAQIIKNNDRIKTISYEDRRYDNLISKKWIFVVILGLLTVEWFVRKREAER